MGRRDVDIVPSIFRAALPNASERKGPKVKKTISEAASVATVRSRRSRARERERASFACSWSQYEYPRVETFTMTLADMLPPFFGFSRCRRVDLCSRVIAEPPQVGLLFAFLGSLHVCVSVFSPSWTCDTFMAPQTMNPRAFFPPIAPP